MARRACMVLGLKQGSLEIGWNRAAESLRIFMLRWQWKSALKCLMAQEFQWALMIGDSC